jgi:hypothetical protein
MCIAHRRYQDFFDNIKMKISKKQGDQLMGKRRKERVDTGRRGVLAAR